MLTWIPIYEGNCIVPKFYVSKTPRGTYKIYDSHQIVIPRFIVRPDPSGKGYKIYEPGKPLFPLYHVKQKLGDE